MKKLAAVLILILFLCAGFAGCMPADSVRNETYFRTVEARAGGNLVSYNISIFSNTDETDVPYDAYDEFKVIPGTSGTLGIGDLVALFDARRIIGFCCMIQAENDCTVEIELYGIDWTRLFKIQSPRYKLGEETIELAAGQKYCLAKDFEYEMGGAEEAEEDEEFADLEEEEKGELIKLRLSEFFLIKVNAENEDGEKVNIRLDSFIFRIINI